MTDRQRQLLGIGAAAIGVALIFIGALFAHFTGLPETNNLGVEIYSFMPRGWGWQLLGQVVAVTGSQIALAGVAIGFLWKRDLTWARATIGAFLFTAEMLILFGIVPNQWLTLAQTTWQWTPQKIFITLPSWLTLNNEVSISYSALKDIVSGTYAAVLLGAIAITMVRWQDYQKEAAAKAKETQVSIYGRPLRAPGEQS
ncbi:MAG: hypothetical protein KJN71_06845 [Acidimicrobiia bacterium]|nr:hypothetical protein [Acidimicrobiia bacterium]NNC75655.1 hypothetical protein [Acidimicrobiia bacterium]